MDFDEYKGRVALQLNMMGLTPDEATALVHLHVDLVHQAYMRAHAARNVAEALMKVRRPPTGRIVSQSPDMQQISKNDPVVTVLKNVFVQHAEDDRRSPRRSHRRLGIQKAINHREDFEL